MISLLEMGLVLLLSVGKKRTKVLVEVIEDFRFSELNRTVRVSQLPYFDCARSLPQQHLHSCFFSNIFTAVKTTIKILCNVSPVKTKNIPKN